MINFPYLDSFSLSFIGHYSRVNLGLPNREKHNIFPKTEFGTNRKVLPHRKSWNSTYFGQRKDVEEILNGGVLLIDVSW